jgi:hypothetical protein
MERAIEILAVIQFGIIGLSHIVQHRAWAAFFIWLRGKGNAGVFVNGFLSLGAGSLIVAFHRVWSGIPLLLTVVGILNLVKAVHSFLWPALSMRSMNRVSLERSWEFAAAGLILLVIAGVLAFHVLQTA